MRSTILILAFVLLSAAAETPKEHLEAMERKAHQEQEAWAADWLLHQDLSLVTVPKLSADPRVSERAAAQMAQEVNSQLRVARQVAEALRTSKGDARLATCVQARSLLVDNRRGNLVKILADRDAVRHELDGPEK